MEVVPTIVADGFPFRVRFTADGGTVVVSHPGSDEVRVYDAENMEERGRVKTGGQPTSIAVGSDGSRVYVVCGAAQEIAEVDLEQMEVVHRYATGSTPDALAVSAVAVGG
jgi:DNA-binding beta-propeller fold protein YncE